MQENPGKGNETSNQTLPLVDTCYTKVQKTVLSGDPLIVVYIEDTSNLISEKGYLLYNPDSGLKTNFETICGEEALGEKEDVTADEDSDNKLLKYIYLRPASQVADESGPTSCPNNTAPLYRNNMIDYSKCMDKDGQYEVALPEENQNITLYLEVQR